MEIDKITGEVGGTPFASKSVPLHWYHRERTENIRGTKSKREGCCACVGVCGVCVCATQLGAMSRVILSLLTAGILLLAPSRTVAFSPTCSIPHLAKWPGGASAGMVHPGSRARLGGALGLRCNIGKPGEGDMVGRGDLANGGDDERNAQVAALKKMFYEGGDAEGVPKEEGRGADEDGEISGRVWVPMQEDERISVQGTMLDMPLCRWEAVMLPGFNNLLNVWQPMYTHMFEQIISGPKPWYYVHLHTPGGTRNLMNPEYALKQGSKAPMVGVLMRIESAQRTKDSRLALVVQGLGRVRVVKPTQSEPYAKADVQLLPDAELCQDCYQGANDELKMLAGEDGCDWEQWVHTVAHAGAVRAGMDWLRFECANVKAVAGSVSQLVPLNSSDTIQAEISVSAPERSRQAIKQAAQQALDGELEAVLSPTDLQLVGVLGGRQSGATLAAFGSSAGGFPGGVLGIEKRVWWEIDLMIRNLRKLQENIPVPSQMLGLLPLEVEGGWPEGFTLASVADGMEGVMVGTSSRAPFVRVGPDYDPKRRAQRLSYVTCSLLGLDQGMPGQAILEAWSTEHRLSMLLKLLTDINRELQKRGI